MRITFKDGVAPVAALGNVVNSAREFDSQSASYDARIAWRFGLGKRFPVAGKISRNTRLAARAIPLFHWCGMELTVTRRSRHAKSWLGRKTGTQIHQRFFIPAINDGRARNGDRVPRKKYCT